MDDETRRRAMGKLGRARVEQELAWEHQSPPYWASTSSSPRLARRRVPVTAGS